MTTYFLHGYQEFAAPPGAASRRSSGAGLLPPWRRSSTRNAPGSSGAGGGPRLQPALPALPAMPAMPAMPLPQGCRAPKARPRRPAGVAPLSISLGTRQRGISLDIERGESASESECFMFERALTNESLGPVPVPAGSPDGEGPGSPQPGHSTEGPLLVAVKQV
jgi:hypothetical protein